MENKGTMILAIAVVILSVVTYLSKDTIQIRTTDGDPVEVLSGQPSPEVFTHQYFFNAYSAGGVATVATTSATYTLKDSEIRDASVISISSVTNAAALTLTLPASTTWQSLPKNGTMQTWVVDNLHTSAATTSTITAGTGVDIDGTGANDDVVNGGVSATLSCWKLPTSDVRCIVQEMVDAG